MTVTANLTTGTDGRWGMVLGVLVFTGAAATQGKTWTATWTTSNPAITFPAGTALSSSLLAALASGDNGVTPTVPGGQTITFNGNRFLADLRREVTNGFRATMRPATPFSRSMTPLRAVC
jgi:hypothetical protein